MVCKATESYGFQPAGAEGSWFQNVPFVKLAVVRDKCSSKWEPKNGCRKEPWHQRLHGGIQQTLPASFVVLGDMAECSEGQFSGQLLVVQGSGRIRFDHPFLLKAKPTAILIVSADAEFVMKPSIRTKTRPVRCPL